MFIYPEYPLKIRKDKKTDRTEVWDIIRKQWIALTPEELVRQYFIYYLIHEKNYPLETIVVEKEFSVYNTKKRFDVAVLNKNQKFILVGECKAPSVPLDEKVIEQVLIYNLGLDAQYLVITNGLQQYVFEKGEKRWRYVEGIKKYRD